MTLAEAGTAHGDVSLAALFDVDHPTAPTQACVWPCKA